MRMKIRILPTGTLLVFYCLSVHGIIRCEVDQNVKHSAVENQMMQTSGEDNTCPNPNPNLTHWCA